MVKSQINILVILRLNHMLEPNNILVAAKSLKYKEYEDIWLRRKVCGVSSAWNGFIKNVKRVEETPTFSNWKQL